MFIHIHSNHVWAVLRAFIESVVAYLWIREFGRMPVYDSISAIVNMAATWPGFFFLFYVRSAFDLYDYIVTYITITMIHINIYMWMYVCYAFTWILLKRSLWNFVHLILKLLKVTGYIFFIFFFNGKLNKYIKIKISFVNKFQYLYKTNILGPNDRFFWEEHNK